MESLKALMFLCLVVAMVMSAEPKRVKKQVLAGAYPYVYSSYASPSAYSAYASPSAYSAYAYPTAYSGAAYPYSAYSGYPYSSIHY